MLSHFPIFILRLQKYYRLASGLKYSAGLDFDFNGMGLYIFAANEIAG